MRSINERLFNTESFVLFTAETVRELQEALDRIEHDMAPNLSQDKQGKVSLEKYFLI